MCMYCPVALVKLGKGVSDMLDKGQNGPVLRPQLGHVLQDHAMITYAVQKQPVK